MGPADPGNPVRTVGTKKRSARCFLFLYLAGGKPTPLKKYMKVNGKDDIPYIMENKKCLKPPTSYCSITIEVGYVRLCKY